MFDIDKIPLDDPEAWDILGRGFTIGVFQLESSLGRHYTKKLKPTNVDELSALTALLRPGAMNAKDENGVSMTDHYIKRKNKEEEVVYPHPALIPMLKRTYGSLVFQESMMQIAADIAGFDLIEVDRLRKAAGKKSASEMSEMLKIFVDKATIKGIVTHDEAQQIADWIRASARYSFNAAHSYSYGIKAYQDAYLKSRYPLEFFKDWMDNSDNDANFQESIAGLVNEAKHFNIEVYPPCLIKGSDRFSIIDEIIYFGYGNIVGIGESQSNKIKQAIKDAEANLAKPLKDFTWLECLIELNISPSIFKILIQAGAFRNIHPDRKRLVFEVSQIERPKKITKGEWIWIQTNYRNYNTLEEILLGLAQPKKQGGGCHSEDRIPAILSIVKILQDPPMDIMDYPDEIVTYEEKLLGTGITCSRLDKFMDVASPNITLREFISGKLLESMYFAVEVKRVGRYTIKKGNSVGRQMAFLTLEDQSASCDDVVVFADQYDILDENNLLYEGAYLLVQGTKDDKKGSLVIQFAKQLKRNV